MGKTRIVGDSTCDLSQPIKERLGIGQIPLYVNLDGKSYRDGVDITPDDIYAYVERTHEIPKTAAPSVQMCIRDRAQMAEPGVDIPGQPQSDVVDVVAGLLVDRQGQAAGVERRGNAHAHNHHRQGRD